MAAIPTSTHGEDFSIETRIDSPSHFLIKIDSFSLLEKHGIHKYEAKEFPSGEYKWRLIIYPHGCRSDKDRGENKDNHISVYVAMVETSSLPVDWEVNAMFTIFLYNHTLDNYLCFRGNVCRFHALKSKWGFSQMISKKSFMDPSNGYLVDDNCVFGAEVFVIKSQRVFERLSAQKYVGLKKHTMEILNYSQLKEVWCSEEFRAGNCKWKIKLYTNGNGRGAEGKSVSMFLEGVDLALHQKVKADFCLRIRNQFNDESTISNSSTHCFTTSAPDRGWASFAPIADMQDPKKGLVVSDCCVIETEIVVKPVLKEVP